MASDNQVDAELLAELSDGFYSENHRNASAIFPPTEEKLDSKINMIFQWELKWHTFCRIRPDQTWKIMHYPTDLEEKCITPKERICTSLLSYFSKIDYFHIASSSFSLIYASSFYKRIKYHFVSHFHSIK